MPRTFSIGPGLFHFLPATIPLYMTSVPERSGAEEPERRTEQYKEETKMKPEKTLNVRNVVLIGMFGALAAVLETFQISVPFAPPFYKLDFAETPILIGAFALGPVPALFMELVKTLLKLLIKGTTTMYVGDLANFIGSAMFILPAALLYQRKKTRKTAMIGLVLSVITAVAGAVIINCFVTLPLYAKLAFGGIENIIAMGTKVNPAITDIYTFAIFAIVPFNLLKCGLNAGITAVLYKRVSVILRTGATVPAERPSAEKV